MAYAIAVDALTHPGSAVPTPIDSAVCTRPNVMPGVNPLNIGMYGSIFTAAGAWP
jgi:hypothetical protein